METHEFVFPRGAHVAFSTPRIGSVPALVANPDPIHESVPIEVYEGDAIIVPSYDPARMTAAMEQLRKTAERMGLNHLHVAKIRGGQSYGAFAFDRQCDPLAWVEGAMARGPTG